MSAGFLLHGLAALVVTVAGLGGGAGFAFVASPLVVSLVLQGWILRRTPGSDAPRRSIGLGAGCIGLGVALAFFGTAGGGLACLLAGAALVVFATQLSLRGEAPPRGQTLPRDVPLVVRAGLALDEGARLAIEGRVLASAWPAFRDVAAEARIAADRNREEGWLAHPERAHEPTPPLEKPRLSRIGLRGFGDVEELRFASEFEPCDPEVRRDYLERRRSRTAGVALLRAPGGPRPALVFVHGSDPRALALGARALGLDRLARELGVDVALYAPPPLGPTGAVAGLLAGRVLWTNAAVGQAIWELRRLAGFLQAEGATEVGVVGLGLGGYVAAAFASVHDGLACAASLHAPASLEACYWHLLPPVQRAAARAAGLSRHVLEHAWARHSPLRMRPRVPHAARLVVGGLADRLVPPRQVEALWEHWGQPAVLWHPGAHWLWGEAEHLRERLREHVRASFAAGD